MKLLGCVVAGFLAAGCASTQVATVDGCEPVSWSRLQGNGPGLVGSHAYEGQLWMATGVDANGSEETFFVITLDRAICLPGGTATTEVQVYSPEDAVRAQLEASLDQQVRVTGPGFDEHTAHHHRPIIVEAKVVEVEQRDD